MDYDINALPNYLRKDLIAFLEGMNDPSKEHIMDCLRCELEGSIKAAAVCHEIPAELADFLMYEYLYERQVLPWRAEE